MCSEGFRAQLGTEGLSERLGLPTVADLIEEGAVVHFSLHPEHTHKAVHLQAKEGHGQVRIGTRTNHVSMYENWSKTLFWSYFA